MTARRPAKKATAKPTVFGEFDWDQLLEEPERATASVPLCFKAASTRSTPRWRRSWRLPRRSGRRSTIAASAPGDDLIVLAEQIEAVEAEMFAAATQTIELQAMRAPDFRALKDRYPPRPATSSTSPTA